MDDSNSTSANYSHDSKISPSLFFFANSFSQEKYRAQWNTKGKIQCQVKHWLTFTKVSRNNLFSTSPPESHWENNFFQKFISKHSFINRYMLKLAQGRLHFLWMKESDCSDPGISRALTFNQMWSILYVVISPAKWNKRANFCLSFESLDEGGERNKPKLSDLSRICAFVTVTIES